MISNRLLAVADCSFGLQTCFSCSSSTFHVMIEPKVEAIYIYLDFESVLLAKITHLFPYAFIPGGKCVEDSGRYPNHVDQQVTLPRPPH